MTSSASSCFGERVPSTTPVSMVAKANAAVRINLEINRDTQGKRARSGALRGWCVKTPQRAVHKTPQTLKPPPTTHVEYATVSSFEDDCTTFFQHSDRQSETSYSVTPDLGADQRDEGCVHELKSYILNRLEESIQTLATVPDQPACPKLSPGDGTGLPPTTHLHRSDVVDACNKIIKNDAVRRQMHQTTLRQVTAQFAAGDFKSKRDCFSSQDGPPKCAFATAGYELHIPITGSVKKAKRRKGSGIKVKGQSCSLQSDSHFTASDSCGETPSKPSLHAASLHGLGSAKERPLHTSHTYGSETTTSKQKPDGKIPSHPSQLTATVLGKAVEARQLRKRPVRPLGQTKACRVQSAEQVPFIPAKKPPLMVERNSLAADHTACTEERQIPVRSEQALPSCTAAQKSPLTVESTSPAAEPEHTTCTEERQTRPVRAQRTPTPFTKDEITFPTMGTQPAPEDPPSTFEHTSSTDEPTPHAASVAPPITKQTSIKKQILLTYLEEIPIRTEKVLLRRPQTTATTTERKPFTAEDTATSVNKNEDALRLTQSSLSTPKGLTATLTAKRKQRSRLGGGFRVNRNQKKTEVTVKEVEQPRNPQLQYKHSDVGTMGLPCYYSRQSSSLDMPKLDLTAFGLQWEDCRASRSPITPGSTPVPFLPSLQCSPSFCSPLVGSPIPDVSSTYVPREELCSPDGSSRVDDSPNPTAASPLESTCLPREEPLPPRTELQPPEGSLLAVKQLPVGSSRTVKQSSLGSPRAVKLAPLGSPRAVKQSPVASPRVVKQSPVASPRVVKQSPAASPRVVKQSPAASPRVVKQSPAASPRAVKQSPVASPRAVKQSPVTSPRAVKLSPRGCPRFRLPARRICVRVPRACQLGFED
ncbi:hypothetical protein BaRGS_00008224 [Batillaria attramentaria]|uniref:Uncharacterized protein n=1 Tax=Batillaria attramentaria TaxID=370345 RepID=A0ABD0LNP6_9CAEN